MAENVFESSGDFGEKIAANPRIALYKKPIRKNNYKTDLSDDESPQEIRRQRLLEEQKRKRDATFNASRGLLDEALHSDEEMEVQRDENSRRSRKFHCYANQFMMSEWMLQVPPDLLDKWLMVPCPQGQRTLLIACKGATRAYSKRGFRLGKFSSALPGGTYQDYKSSCTILDCIWVKETRTYYTLDVLAWSNQTLFDCDTEFRFFWLKTRLEETQGLKDRGSPVNSYPILSLPSFPCDTDAFTFSQSISSLPPLDGLLFYHRETHYTRGRTPLVNWLKPFMLPEVLGIEFFLGAYEKPADYVDMKSYMRNSGAKRKGKKNVQLDDLMESTSMESTASMEMT